MTSRGNDERVRQGRLGAMGRRPAANRSAPGRPDAAAGRLAVLLGGLDAGACWFDSQGVITYCNAAFAALAGQTSRRLTGRKLRKNALWGEAGRRDEFRDLFMQARTSRQPLSLRSLPVRKPGRPAASWDLQFIPAYSKKGRYEGMGLLARDVTGGQGQGAAGEMLNRYYEAALQQPSPQHLLHELVRLLQDYSGCPSVQVAVLDRARGMLVKAGSERSRGLWDSGPGQARLQIEDIFNHQGEGNGPPAAVYLPDVQATEDGLEGVLKEMVSAACDSYGYKSLALVPVMLEGSPAGYIQLASAEVNGVSPQMLEAVGRIAGHLQVILEHAGLKDELRQQRQALLKQVYERSAHLESLSERLKLEVAERRRMQEEMQVQRDLAVALNGIETMQEALDLCLDTAIRVSGMDSGGIYLADQAAGGFRLLCSRGVADNFVRVVSFRSASDPQGELIMGGSSLYGKFEELTSPSDETLLNEGLKGIGVIPISHGGKVVACLNISTHIFEEIPAGARTAIESIAAVLGSFIAHIGGRQELAESEERYRTLFAHTANPILVIDSEGNYIDGNDATLGFLECTREEYLAMNVRDTLPPYLDDEWYEGLRRIWETGGTLERDYYVWGKIKTLELIITPMQIGGRRIIFGIGKDVTERKAAEAAMRESEEKYRTLIDNAGEAILIVQDARIKFANRRCFEFQQYQLEELLERPFSDFIHDEDRPMVLERYAARLGGAEVEPVYTFRFVDRDGTIKWAEMRVSILNWEGRPATLALLTDVTARKQAEESLRSSEERYRLLADNSLDVIWTADMKLNINYVSPSVLQHTGCTAEDVTVSLQENPLHAVSLGFSEAGVQDRMEALRKLAHEKSGASVRQYEVSHRDGTVHWVEETLSIMRDDGGRPVGILGVMHDISEQKKMMQQLVAADRLASMGEMAAGLANEVKNPLSAVMGFAYLLQQDPVTPAPMKKDIDAIYRESKRATDVIDNFLLFTRGQKTEKQVVQVNDIIQAALGLRRSHLEKQGIKVTTSLAAGLPSVQANSAQIQQVLVNILLNAEHFMYQAHGGGSLSINTGLEGANVLITVADDGPGIPPDHIERIFEPFYTTREPGEGTGLGLSICHGIVREHGGKIYAANLPTGGAAFTVELPAGQQGFILG